MGIVNRILAKRVAIASDRVEAAQEKKRHHEELGRILLHYRLDVVNEARSSKKIKEVAKDDKGQVKYYAEGGGFMSDKSSATLRNQDDEALGSVSLSDSNYDIFTLHIYSDGRTIKVSHVRNPDKFFQLFGGEIEVQPFGWRVEYASNGIFGSWYFIFDGDDLIARITYDNGVSYVEAIESRYLFYVFAIYIGFNKLYKEQKD